MTVINGTMATAAAGVSESSVDSSSPEETAAAPIQRTRRGVASASASTARVWRANPAARETLELLLRDAQQLASNNMRMLELLGEDVGDAFTVATVASTAVGSVVSEETLTSVEWGVAWDLFEDDDVDDLDGIAAGDGSGVDGAAGGEGGVVARGNGHGDVDSSGPEETVLEVGGLGEVFGNGDDVRSDTDAADDHRSSGVSGGSISAGGHSAGRAEQFAPPEDEGSRNGREAAAAMTTDAAAAAATNSAPGVSEPPVDSGGTQETAAAPTQQGRRGTASASDWRADPAVREILLSLQQDALSMQSRNRRMLALLEDVGGDAATAATAASTAVSSVVSEEASVDDSVVADEDEMGANGSNSDSDQTAPFAANDLVDRTNSENILTASATNRPEAAALELRDETPEAGVPNLVDTARNGHSGNDNGFNADANAMGHTNDEATVPEQEEIAVASRGDLDSDSEAGSCSSDNNRKMPALKVTTAAAASAVKASGVSEPSVNSGPEDTAAPIQMRAAPASSGKGPPRREGAEAAEVKRAADVKRAAEDIHELVASLQRDALVMRSSTGRMLALIDKGDWSERKHESSNQEENRQFPAVRQARSETNRSGTARKSWRRFRRNLRRNSRQILETIRSG